jgi:hypothetical protein
MRSLLQSQSALPSIPSKVIAYCFDSIDNSGFSQMFSSIKMCLISLKIKDNQLQHDQS